jgi:hypothetical protein
MKNKIYLLAIACIFLSVVCSHSEAGKYEEFRGVVTFQLLPAKVLKINKIIENPKAGTSYIGDEGILVRVDENPNVMANWTVVEIKYYNYPEPKVIKYEIFSEQKEIVVNFHAVSVEVDGDLSKYINEQ